MAFGEEGWDEGGDAEIDAEGEEAAAKTWPGVADFEQSRCATFIWFVSVLMKLISFVFTPATREDSRSWKSRMQGAGIFRLPAQDISAHHLA